jgi:polygalacturonase
MPKVRCVLTLVVLLVGFQGASRGVEAREFNVRDLGAKGDGISLDTKAFQDAFDQARAAGGGLVIVPPGTYLCGSMQLYSNTTLRVEKGPLSDKVAGRRTIPMVVIS